MAGTFNEAADGIARGWIVANGTQKIIKEFSDFSPEWLIPASGEIFLHAREIELKGRPANLITITQALLESGRLDWVGGPAAVLPGHDTWEVVASSLEALRGGHLERQKAAIAAKLASGDLSADQAKDALGKLAGEAKVLRDEVELPRVNRLLSDFSREIGEVCSRNGVFLLDGVPVVLQPHSDRMEDLTPDSFRTYVEKDVLCWRLVKTKGEDGKPHFERGYESMGKMAAAAVLQSHEFRRQQRPLRMISRIPLPIFKDDKLVLQGPGYDRDSQILVKE